MQFTFAHNNLNVRNLKESIAFYEQALGLRETKRIEATDGSFLIVIFGRRALGSQTGAHLAAGSQGKI